MSAVDLKGKDADWTQLFNMITVECPHARIENLVVVEGAPWGYTYIDFTKVRPREAQRNASGPSERLNPDWQWFIHECQELRDGIITEVHFRDGNPITIRGVKSAMGRISGLLGGGRAEPRRALALA